MPLLIQGIFFQNKQSLEIAYIGGGVGSTVVVNEELCETIFAGVIWQDRQNVLGGLAGNMMDLSGVSRLALVRVSDTEVRFKKLYYGRDDEILFVFSRREGDVWLGEYSGAAVGNGIARCILTEVSDDFFDPNSLAQKLGVTAAHHWPERHVG